MTHGTPLAIDLYCGLGGWAEGFLAEGYRVIGFDIEAHDYGAGGYPGDLILRDVRSLHGQQFADATCIVASPPCQEWVGIMDSDLSHQQPDLKHNWVGYAVGVAAIVAILPKQQAAAC